MKKTGLLFLLLLFFFASCSTSVKMLNQEDFVVKNTHDVSETLEEISSLEKWNDTFYGINDSGGETKIYTFKKENPSQIAQEIELKNATNIDWEATAQSDSLIFVADFGNNIGNRKDLKIYMVPKDKILGQFTYQIVDQEAFSFFYPEQKDYSNQAYNHDFDAESLIFFNGKLHLFTKEWKSAKTHHYTLDIVNGNQPAWLVESYETGFYVTGADVFPLSEKKSKLAMVGYTRDGNVYLLLTEFRNKSDKWLKNAKEQIYLGFSGDVGQVEGVTFLSENELCYSAEKITTDEKIVKQNVTCVSLK